MGTSTSSSGPGSGVPFDPPWLPDFDGGNQIPANAEPNDNSPEQADEQSNLPTLAPPARFRASRISMGKFINSGDKSSFEKASGHYSKTGMGGAKNVSHRMRQVAATGAQLASFLREVRSTSNRQINDWLDKISTKNLNPQQIANEIVRNLAPNTGTLDDESCSESMSQALSNYISKHEDSDLCNLEEDAIREIVENYVTVEAYNRLMQDIGQKFESSTLSPSEKVDRREEMKGYLHSELCPQMEKLWEINNNPNQNQIQNIIQTAIENTFKVYEGTL